MPVRYLWFTTVEKCEPPHTINIFICIVSYRIARCLVHICGCGVGVCTYSIAFLVIWTIIRHVKYIGYGQFSTTLIFLGHWWNNEVKMKWKRKNKEISLMRNADIESHLNDASQMFKFFHLQIFFSTNTFFPICLFLGFSLMTTYFSVALIT